MIKLLNQTLVTDDEWDQKYFKYEVIKDNEVSNAVSIFQSVDEEVISVDIEKGIDFNRFIRMIEGLTIDQLVSYESVCPEYKLSFADYYYNWEYLYFPIQFFNIKNTQKEKCLSISFYLPDEDTSSWPYKFSPSYTINQLIKLDPNFAKEREKEESYSFDPSPQFKVTYPIKGEDKIVDIYNQMLLKIREIEFNLYNKLEGFHWKDEYGKDEKKFTIEVLLPLLRKMKFKGVRYIHGVDEYGRDLTFYEINKFDERINFGLQAKAGNISGGANSLIDTIISQFDDAFKMHYLEIGNSEKQYISYFIVATSGYFKKNAKKKMLEKIPEQLRRYVFFWDKEIILNLIEEHWNKML